MTIRQSQVAKDEHFVSKLNLEKDQHKTMSEMNALKSLENDIAAFERKNLGKVEDDSDEEPQGEPKEMSKKASSLLDKSEPQLLRPRDDQREEKRMGAAETEKKRHQR